MILYCKRSGSPAGCWLEGEHVACNSGPIAEMIFVSYMQWAKASVFRPIFARKNLSIGESLGSHGLLI